MPADEARRMSGWHLPLAVSPVWGPVWSSPKAPPLLPSQRHTTRCPTRPRHHDQFDHDDQTSTAHSAIHTRTPWPPPCSHAHTHTRWSAGWCCWRESSPARFVPARTQSQLSVSREQDPPPCTCTRPTKSRAPALPIHSLHSLSLPYMPLLPRTAGQLGQQPSHQAGGALSPTSRDCGRHHVSAVVERVKQREVKGMMVSIAHICLLPPPCISPACPKI